MSYKDQLHPWCVVRTQPNLESMTIARFRRRAEAESHVQHLKRTMPNANYVILFSNTPIEAVETVETVETEPVTAG